MVSKDFIQVVVDEKFDHATVMEIRFKPDATAAGVYGFFSNIDTFLFDGDDEVGTELSISHCDFDVQDSLTIKVTNLKEIGTTSLRDAVMQSDIVEAASIIIGSSDPLYFFDVTPEERRITKDLNQPLAQAGR